MQLPEIDFSSLEIKEIGAWPIILRIPVIIGIVLVAIIAVCMFVLAPELSVLSDTQKKLTDKKAEFKDQYTQSINIDAYRAQMKDMQAAYEEYVKELPSSSNIPELIDSITKIEKQNGLKFNSIKLGDPKLVSGFYMELPFTLNVSGRYHGLGLFVSDVANLARIVTINDFNIKPLSDKASNIQDLLEMNLEAKTYWLASLSELEQQKSIEAKQPVKPGAPKGAQPSSMPPGVVPGPHGGARSVPPLPGGAGATTVPTGGSSPAILNPNSHKGTTTPIPPGESGG